MFAIYYVIKFSWLYHLWVQKNFMAYSDKQSINTTKSNNVDIFGISSAKPMLWLAHQSTYETVGLDKRFIVSPMTVGRSKKSQFVVSDHKMSGVHFVIRLNLKKEVYEIKDLNSTNGTYVNGKKIFGAISIVDNDVVRAGNTVFVFTDHDEPALSADKSSSWPFIGRFYSGELYTKLQEAALSRRPVLLTGPSGSGKELAAKELTQIKSKQKNSTIKIVVHNAANFSSEEEAQATIFGVEKNIFTSVQERAGLIENAEGGVLFLDETHNLSPSLQKSLLRIVVDKCHSRIGSTKNTHIDVDFIFASNEQAPLYGLVPDLKNRLFVIEIAPLTKRRTDIPELFLSVLKNKICLYGLSKCLDEFLMADHFETMCIDGFPDDNVRGIIDLADKICVSIAAGKEPQKALQTVFRNRFGNSPVAARLSVNDDTGSSHYDKNKNLILNIYHNNNNISETEKLLKQQGIRCSHRWLSHYLKQWNLQK
ncbi:MAG: sigma 54-interacting transcriptional regulator [Deltaproteobacteria bacterium]|nr:sigma 54-interacting transcriptional regulator [Deltaproteobacteria bacterium]